MTAEERKKQSAQIIDKISSLDNDNKTLSDQIEDYSGELMDDSKEECTQRNLCLSSANKFLGAMNELIKLYGYSRITGTREAAFLNKKNIRLAEYIPEYDTYAELLGLKKTVEDLEGCWNILCKYSDNSNRSLNNYFNIPSYKGDYYDDDYSVVSQISELNDINFNFDNLLEFDTNGFNSLRCIIAAKNNFKSNFNYFIGQISLNSIDGPYSTNTYTDGTGRITNSYASGISTSGSYVGNTTDFYLCKNTDGEADIVQIISASYTSGYYSEGGGSPSTITVIYKTLSGKKCDFSAKPVLNDLYSINFSFLRDVLKSLADYYSSNEAIDDNNKKTSPDINYKNLYNMSLSINEEILKNILEYISKRIIICTNYINNKDNSDFLNSCIKNRLDKNDGTLIKWYKNVTSLDGSMSKLKKEYRNAKTMFSKLVVIEAVSDPDENFIITKNGASEYYKKVIGYTPTIKSGDKVYIIDDNNAETSTLVKKVEASKADGDVTMNEDEYIINEVDALKFIFENYISDAYSSDRALRIVKELS